VALREAGRAEDGHQRHVYFREGLKPFHELRQNAEKPPAVLVVELVNEGLLTHAPSLARWKGELP
jgi:hypothetical protein